MMPRKPLGLSIALVLVLASCGTYRYAHKANEAKKVENWDAAVYYYLEALAQDPDNASLKIDLQRARIRAAEVHFRQGLEFKNANDLQRARSEFELAVQLDPTHQYAETELRKVQKDLEILSEKGGAAKLEAMKKAASEMKVKPPVLNPASNEPISLMFPNPTNVKDIYKAIGDAFGINILFDPKLKDQKISIELKDVTAQQALENVMQAANHFYKVLDNKTIIVVEDTPQNRRDYEDLVVKTFFLSNADVKDINNMLRALIDARRIAVNEQLNAIIIRDTADKVAIAERLINANDKAKAEVLVDVELIQVDSHKLRDLGMSLSSYAYPITLDPTAITGSSSTTRIPLPRLGDITRSMWGLVVPNLTLSLIKSADEAETLAQPELRITEGEKANLVIGDKVPIPTTTFNTTQTIGGNIVPITAFQYQDVGIKLDIEPRVHHNNEVTLKLQVEVSELGGNVDLGNGQTQPKIGTRTINSVIRLKDGETSLLAGLFKYNRTKSRSGIPWLSDIPGIGALFRDNSNDYRQTDLILTLTPHIIRNPDITEEDLAPIWVGTENRISIFGNSPRMRSPYPQQGPFNSGAPVGLAPGFPGAGQEVPETGTPGTGAPTGAAPPRLRIPPVTRPKIPQGASQSVPVGGDDAVTSPAAAATSAAEQTAAGTEAAAAANAVTEPAPGTPADSTVTASVEPPTPAASAGAAGTTAVPAGTAAARAVADGFPADTAGLAHLSFYPARLPVVVGATGQFSVVLDPAAGGTGGPIHLAYDPARLEVVSAEGGQLPEGDSTTRVTVTHTPAVGWITLSWSGDATASGTLVYLTVRPREMGELPVIFAGPIGALVAHPGTVVALPQSATSVVTPQP
jgi:general secretion pathway protein D